MKFEHFALNVGDARATAGWYVEHLGLAIVRSIEQAPHTRFLADSSGRLVMELYSNPAAAQPDYRASHPTTFHVAFVAEDARATRERLARAGASPISEEVTADGTVLVMMRDPWGLPIQLCQRVRPLG